MLYVLHEYYNLSSGVQSDTNILLPLIQGKSLGFTYTENIYLRKHTLYLLHLLFCHLEFWISVFSGQQCFDKALLEIIWSVECVNVTVFLSHFKSTYSYFLPSHFFLLILVMGLNSYLNYCKNVLFTGTIEILL